MKKSLLILLLLFLISSLFATEYKIADLSCSSIEEYTDFLVPTTIEIKYETDMKDQYLFKYKDTYYCFIEETVSQLRSVCEKYFEWEKIAIDNKAEIKKEIPIRIKTIALWSLLSNNETCMGQGEIYFTFYCQGANDYRLVMASTKIKDIFHEYNLYANVTLEDLVFSKKDVENMYKSISEENLKKQKELANEKRAVEDLFN